MSVTKIEINPMTRLEGHGKITVFLDEQGNVDNAFFQTVELRGYEQFLRGMPIEEVPRTVSTICGVCRCVHFTASVKAADAVYQVEPTPTARKIRELVLNSHYVEDHAAILYALGFPDFVAGPTASPAERNLIGLIQAVGAETGKLVLKKRYAAVKVIEMLAGKPIHPVAALPGGWSKRVTEEERKEILALAKEMVELGQLTLKVFEDVVLKNENYMKLVTGDVYKVVVNYMGTVDEKNRVQYYDGIQRIVDTEGREIGRFTGKGYLDFIAERVLPWSYLKMPYLKPIGWKGIVDGPGTSLYCVGPLARLNVAEGMDTPLAQEAYERMFATFGVKPVHNILAYHWARAIELLNAAEKVQQIAADESITSPDVRAELGKPSEGVGIIEACRGTLIHHYKTDDKGIVQEANLIVATTHNKGPINVAVRRAAAHFIRNGKVDEGILNLVEIAYRPYDICLACATHVLPGRLPVQVDIYDHKGELYKTLRNF
ncbi:F420-non-reducing hydrogenase subunit A [Thermodesulfitimonas autotrophica]|uniref:F420-non-reducing hydrogenase subunit A n=1 Tax=Thermodesulfitimonas autotrophica TaxID=1894989 RepID=A0A3N5B0U7_9THEO|nr:Ni/Fe hydrogenase subunit alpha [Thermodesulfitimonas autotrophica]RPF49250.1 F420-non-reducing hydrogenase subunit A [Thermodesulfitimonas autotrophica]